MPGRVLTMDSGSRGCRTSTCSVGRAVASASAAAARDPAEHHRSPGWRGAWSRIGPIAPRMAPRVSPGRLAGGTTRDAVPALARARVRHLARGSLQRGLEDRRGARDLHLRNGLAHEPLDVAEQASLLRSRRSSTPCRSPPRARCGRCGARSPRERAAGRSSRRGRSPPRRCPGRRCRSPPAPGTAPAGSLQRLLAAGPASGWRGAARRGARRARASAPPCRRRRLVRVKTSVLGRPRPAARAAARLLASGRRGTTRCSAARRGGAAARDLDPHRVAEGCARTRRPRRPSWPRRASSGGRAGGAPRMRLSWGLNPMSSIRSASSRTRSSMSSSRRRSATRGGRSAARAWR